ncbi:hypothetical protein ANN_26755 [Periplaneta americana]|uniref:Uncharacterized protein n=1 Tax=Periplaneta americana TaxID=6978 RepID=A0ABQ8RYX7_PERAM|nr:hypothetical protein ANN_26755 [Periplaneta americana]
MLDKFKVLGYNMNLKLHFLLAHIEYFPANLGALSEEQENTEDFTYTKIPWKEKKGNRVCLTYILKKYDVQSKLVAQTYDGCCHLAPVAYPLVSSPLLLTTPYHQQMFTLWIGIPDWINAMILIAECTIFDQTFTTVKYFILFNLSIQHINHDKS